MDAEDPAVDDILSGFGPNERAMLERVPRGPLRRLAAFTVHTKERLQFTGWLQYVVPLVPMAGLAAVAGLCWVVGLVVVAKTLGVVLGLLFAKVLFDLATVRFRLHPQEARPAPLDGLDVFDLMRARRSCRSFQTRALQDDDRDALLRSVEANLALPTFGPSPIRLEYIRAPLTVWPTVNASEFLVAIVPQPYDRRAVIDVGRVLQHVVLEATRRGLATCWIGPGADQESLAHHLGDRFDPARDQLICVCAVGYRSRFVPLFIQVFSRQMRQRMPLAKLFFGDRALEQVVDLEAGPYRRFGRSFEACRWGPSSYNGQTTRGVVHVEDGEVTSVDFIAVTSSRYYAPVALGVWCANWETGCEALGLEGRFQVQPPADKVVAPRWDLTWVRAQV